MTDSATGGACRVCGNAEGNREFRAREMMFGTREEFDYLECGGCGCLQIREVPADLARHYPPEYVAFSQTPPSPRPFRDWLLARRTAAQLGGRSLLGSLLSRLHRNTPLYVEWTRRAGANQSSRILEVGCGNGFLLSQMACAGYRDLSGVDPFVEKSVRLTGGVNITRGSLAEVTGEYDLVMMHHAFEHVPDPQDTLEHLSRILRPGGYALIRIPVADSWAWREYGVDWVQLDAPRHIFLHTRESMELLARTAELELVDVVHDSWAIQFWGSEQYRHDIPLTDPRSVQVRVPGELFSAEDVQAFERRAAELNARGEGDAAAFYLRKPLKLYA